MYLRSCCAVSITALGMGGCAQPSYSDPATWSLSQPPGIAIEQLQPPAKLSRILPVEMPEPPKPTDAITLGQALSLVLAHNPKLHSFAWEIRAAEARVLQAGLRPNPELEMTLENFAGSGGLSGTQSLETTLSLAQTFPLGNDIQRRRELTDLQAQLANWDYKTARLEVLTETTQHFVTLLGAQQKVRLARESLRLAEQVKNATDRRIRVGDAPPIDAARASVPVATAQVELKRTERQLQAAKRQLALMWSSRQADYTAAEGSLEQLHTPPPPEQLVALVNGNPLIARRAVEISAHLAQAELAKAEAIADITARAGVSYGNADDSGALIFGISLPIAIFDQRQGDVLAAQLSANAAAEQRREAERRIETALSQAYARLIASFDEATDIRDVALPPARDAFNLIHKAFEKGDLALTDVLDAERTLVELRSNYLDALVQYHIALTEIEGLIGRPLTRVDVANISEPHNKEGERP